MFHSAVERAIERNCGRPPDATYKIRACTCTRSKGYAKTYRGMSSCHTNINRKLKAETLLGINNAKTSYQLVTKNLSPTPVESATMPPTDLQTARGQKWRTVAAHPIYSNGNQHLCRLVCQVHTGPNRLQMSSANFRRFVGWLAARFLWNRWPQLWRLLAFLNISEMFFG